MKKLFLTIIIATLTFTAFADEGMWIPSLLKYNMADMKKKGFKLSAEDLYNINQASLKDAIVNIGGCTGGLVSDKGLMLTNHHCGLKQIQYHSSTKNDYITNGFWAANMQEELPCPEMTARFVVRIDDVSDKILSILPIDASEALRKKYVDSLSRKIISDYKLIDKAYTYSITPMYEGNVYLMFVYEIFTDVRLVGAPPMIIGNYGGDTDNWVWPRHTGDFCVFRIYADKSNKPADFSKENKPYTPKKYFEVNIAGVKENDFTMIYGFPGRTSEYLTSYAIKNVIEESSPRKIDLRTKRLNLMNSYMQADPVVRIQYTSKKAGVANAWKKWQGELKGIERFDGINKKIKYEEFFTSKIDSDPSLSQYKSIIPRFEEIYSDIKTLERSDDYYKEAFMAIEVMGMASKLNSFIISKNKNTEIIQKELKTYIDNFFKNYHMPYDVDLFKLMMGEFLNNYPMQNSLPSSVKNILDNDISDLFKNSILVNYESLNGIVSLDSIKINELKDDALFKLYDEITSNYNKLVKPALKEYQDEIAQLSRQYIAAQQKIEPKKIFYPDANSTLRVSYGSIGGFKPSDGVVYTYRTTLDGVIEKGASDPNYKDYKYPEKLEQLWKAKNFGEYGDKGVMPVAFIASNHTTGGNSGSPILNAKGQLIGLNFDRCWESTMSDYMYDPSYCRNIGVDIRYVFFIIDKYAGAKHLLDEMKIIRK